MGRDSVGGGIAIVVGMHLLWLVLLFVEGALVDAGAISGELVVPLMLAPLLFIGVAQVLYAGPAFWWARRSGRTRLAQGLLIGAGLTFLLNTACWGLIVVSV